MTVALIALAPDAAKFF